MLFLFRGGFLFGGGSGATDGVASGDEVLDMRVHDTGCAWDDSGDTARDTASAVGVPETAS